MRLRVQSASKLTQTSSRRENRSPGVWRAQESSCLFSSELTSMTLSSSTCSTDDWPTVRVDSYSSRLEVTYSSGYSRVMKKRGAATEGSGSAISSRDFLIESSQIARSRRWVQSNLISNPIQSNFVPVSRTAAAPVARCPLSLSLVVCFSSRLVSHAVCSRLCSCAARLACSLFTGHPLGARLDCLLLRLRLNLRHLST